MADEEFHAFLRRNGERYREIAHLGDRVVGVESRYASCTYTVRMDEQTRPLTEHDLIVLCDRGNACFGGKVNARTDESATVTVYTD